MGILQKDALTTTVISYFGLLLGYLNKGFLFLLLFSTEQIGLVNLLVAVGILFCQLSNLGMINTVWRFFPFFRNEEKDHYGFLQKILKALVLSFLFFSGLSFFLKPIVVGLYGKNSPLFVDYYFWIIPIGIASVLFIVTETFLRGLNKNNLPVFLNDLVLRLLLTILLGLYAFELISFHAFVISFALSFFIPTTVILLYLLQIKELKFRTKRSKIPNRFVKILYSYTAFSYINSLGTTLVFSLDAMMIASILGLKATGIYTTLLFLISALQIPNKSIFRISSVLVARYWKERNLKEMNILYKKVSSITLIISLYFFLMLWINVNHLKTFLNEDFRQATYPFLFFMIGKIIDMYLGLNGIIFITSKKYRYDMYFTLSMIVLVFVLNLFLIPKFQLIGAAISTSLALIVYNFGRLFFVWKWYRLSPFEKGQLYTGALFAVILLLFQFLPDWGLNIYLTLIFNCSLASMLFLGCLIYFKMNADVNNYLRKMTEKFLRIELKIPR